MYAYLTLREMFEVNIDTEESMKSFLAFFKKKGVANYVLRRECGGGLD